VELNQSVTQSVNQSSRQPLKYATADNATTVEEIHSVVNTELYSPNLANTTFTHIIQSLSTSKRNLQQLI